MNTQQKFRTSSPRERHQIISEIDMVVVVGSTLDIFFNIFCENAHAERNKVMAQKFSQVPKVRHYYFRFRY